MRDLIITEFFQRHYQNNERDLEKLIQLNGTRQNINKVSISIDSSTKIELLKANTEKEEEKKERKK